MKNPKLLSERLVYEADLGSEKYIRVKRSRVRLPDNKTVDWGYVDMNDGVAIIALDKSNNIYLTNQWRVAWKKKILQTPAGAVNGKATEKERRKKAIGELREELGIKPRKLEKLTAAIVYSGSIKSTYHIYLATGLSKVKRTPEENEFLEIVKMPFGRSLRTLMESDLTPAYTKLGLLLVKEKLAKMRA